MATTPRAEPRHPALRLHREERDQSAHHRFADRITGFFGSMLAVYLHLAVFVLWVVLGVERLPFQLLNTILAVEAILLASFVLITQHRADQEHHALADHQWEVIQRQARETEELLNLSRQTLAAAKQIQRANLAGRS
jgi:uncharacterized membrane protein